MKNTTLKYWMRRIKIHFQPLAGSWPRSVLILLAREQPAGAGDRYHHRWRQRFAKPYSGFVNGNTLNTAKFNMPSGMALDTSGNLYIADYTNNAVRLVSSAGNSGSTTTTWVTNGVNHPIAVVLDGLGDVYVLNQGTGANGAILHFTGAGGTPVPQPSLATGLVNATSMAIDGANNLYVTVNGNQVIRVTPTGVVTNIGTVTRAGTSLQRHHRAGQRNPCVDRLRQQRHLAHERGHRQLYGLYRISRRGRRAGRQWQCGIQWPGYDCRSRRRHAGGGRSRQQQSQAGGCDRHGQPALRCQFQSLGYRFRKISRMGRRNRWHRQRRC